ncbi:MAG: putative porin [Bacteroidaceae bacterium]|nr:putative porin [Bacteroidaceae bacterium]
MKRIVFLLTMILAVASTTWAQQRIPNNRTNAMGIGDDLGTNMTDEDRRLANDNNENDTDVTDVPVDLNQWTLSSRFGDVRPTPVDTLWDYYQNANLAEGLHGEYNHLGNFGSPRLSRIFFDREERSQLFFTDAYGMFYLKPDQFHFTDTKSPYTNLSYHNAGDKLTGDDHFKAYFAVNANKRFGFGFLADYLYGRGQYNSQSTAYFNASLYSYYRGERYQAYILGSRYHMKQAENGGITDDRYITDPLEMAEGERTYSPENIPTVMDRAWNRNENWNLFFTHRYNVGFYRDAEPDTTSSATTNTEVEDSTVFVPVTSFIHTAEVSTNEHSFIAYNEPTNYYLHDYMPYDSLDKTTYLSVKNTLAIATHEGFSKWAQAGISAFITHEYRRFSLPDTLIGSRREYRHKYDENVVSVGGRLLRTQGKTLHYDVTGETVIAGEDLGQFSIEGRGDLNFRLFKDTVRLDVHAYMKNLNPAFYFRHYHSHHYWWDNDNLDKIFRTRIEGGLTIDRTHTRLRAGVENVKNYTYFANTSQPLLNNKGEVKSYLNAINVAQCTDNIQVFTARLNQDFKLGILHLDNEVTYQKSSNNTVLPLPDLSLYHNLYIQFKIAKVLSMQLGADMRFFTKYTAPDYAPALGQFVQQNQADKVEIGGYPFVNVYLNAHLKRTRFYVMMYHVNQGTGDSNYFLAPHYPINPRTFQLGLSWNFFD